MGKNQSKKTNQIKKIMRNKLCEFMDWFVVITTGVLIVCSINFTLFGGDDIPKTTLWGILLSGFITTAVTIFFWDMRAARVRAAMIITMLLHYICLCGVMILFGPMFGWMTLRVPDICMMCLSVAAVYIFSFSIDYMQGKRQADEMNQKLKEKYSEEDR